MSLKVTTGLGLLGNAVFSSIAYLIASNNPSLNHSGLKNQLKTFFLVSMIQNTFTLYEQPIQENESFFKKSIKLLLPYILIGGSTLNFYEIAMKTRIISTLTLGTTSLVIDHFIYKKILPLISYNHMLCIQRKKILACINKNTNEEAHMNHVDEILPGIFLGNIFAFYSCDPAFTEKFSSAMKLEIDLRIEAYDNLRVKEQMQRYLERYGYDQNACKNKKIDLIISLVNFVNVKEHLKKTNRENLALFEPDLRNKKHKIFPINDWSGAWENLHPFLEEIFQDIDVCRAKNKPILVHCFGGLSRSSTIIIAYIMRTYNLSYEIAFQFVKLKRPQIIAREWSIAALKKYEGEILSIH